MAEISSVTNKLLAIFDLDGTLYDTKEVNYRSYKEALSKLSCLDLRRICSSALTICYVASGRINGYFEKELKPWDYAAAGLILRECGGQMSDWSGQEIKYILPTSLVCGSKKAYDFLLSIIQSVDS